MKIQFHGAAQTVTGSQHLLTINGHKLLLDCGLYQGPRKESYERNLNFPFVPTDLDAVIMSHAHIDHSGNLPNLVKQGYEGRIYTTPASAHLANIMLLDSGHIQESDAQYLNKKKNKNGKGKHNEHVEPLYTMEDAAQVAQHFEGMKYNQAFEPVPGVQARLVDAGHILGSAAVVLDIEEKGKRFRLWFSGDIGRRNLPLIKDPVLPSETDYLIMEATYGDKIHRDPEAAYDELREVVCRTAERGGKIIVPAFAVGRTQELVYDLHRMTVAGEIPEIPVIVDSPLAVNVSDVYAAHPECFDQETAEFIRSNGHKKAMGFEKLRLTRSVEESKALNDQKGPMLIISASGMAETGRILHHLKNNIEDPKNTILIVSWQAPHTLGRRLADREERVKIFGEVYTRRAEVATIGGLSAHAGQNMLLEYAKAAGKRLKKVFIVHAEEKPANIFISKLREAGINDVKFPGRNSVATLND